MQWRIVKPIDVPEDVLAELDSQERRAGQVKLPPSDRVPEEVRSELDHEARLTDEQQRIILEEGTPPDLEDDGAA